MRYGTALAFTAAALGASVLIPEISLANRNFLFAIAVLASSLYGGLLPGLLVTAVYATSINYFFWTPLGIERTAFLLVEGAVISSIGRLTRETPPTRSRSALFRYSVAVGAAAGVAALKLAAFPIIAERLPFIFCYSLAVSSAWALGFGAAMAGTVVSGLAGYFFIATTDPVPREDRVMTFVLEAALLALVIASYRGIFLRVEAYLLRLFLDSPAGILAVRNDFHVIRANPAMERMLSSREGSIQGTSVLDLLHPASRDCLASVLRGLQQGSGPASADEVRFLCGGKETWTELQAAPIEFPGERDCGWIVIAVDVTDRHETEHRLHDTEARLHHAQKLEALGLLASSIAHDFNNQLAVILGYSEDLVRRSFDEDVRNDASQILRASQKAAEFARQLVTFAQRKTPNPQPINLNSVVSDCKLFLSRLLGERITLLTEFDPRLALVLADAGQIEQILLNLVANAKDAMPRGGKVVLRTANVSFTEPVHAVKEEIPPGNYVALTVADTGEGMDAALLERVFEPFFTTKDATKGTGLGLATVYRNATQLGGYILAASTPGRGTDMTVCLAVVDRAVEESHGASH
jgi:PAS domain S-box-containing protein